MTWKVDIPYRYNVEKCRFRLIPYCQGVGLDIGCGPEKIRPEAIGIDMDGHGDLNFDVSRGLLVLADESFDYVFSSHCLEDMEYPETTLKDWWSKIKVGGHLVLYLPHKDFYPNIGQEGCNIRHKHNFLPEDITDMMDKFATYTILHQKVCSAKDEYSFEFVFKKLANFKIRTDFIDYKSKAVNFDWRSV
jgi:predicted SAM-dependent methyltransferase